MAEISETKEKIENAEIISETKEKESKYFLAIHTAAPLKIASQYEILKADRVEAKNKYCNIDKSDANIENVRKAKNALVKLRTAVNGKGGIMEDDKKRIKEVFNDIQAEFDYKVNSLVGITEPLEKDLNAIVVKFDDKAKEEERKKAEEIDRLKQQLANFKHDKLSVINTMQKSSEIVTTKPEGYEKIQDLANIVEADLLTAYNSRIAFLKEREDLEVEKVKVAEQMAKLKSMAMPKPEVLEKLTEMTDPIAEILDLEELDEPAPVKLVELIDAETSEAINELDELMKPFDPSLKEIYDHLYANYPFLHNNKYFMALRSKI